MDMMHQHQAQAHKIIDGNNNNCINHSDCDVTVLTADSDSSSSASFISHPDIDTIYKNMINLTLNPSATSQQSFTFDTTSNSNMKKKKSSLHNMHRRRSIDNGGIGIIEFTNVSSSSASTENGNDENNNPWKHRIDEILNRDPELKKSKEQLGAVAAMQQQPTKPRRPRRRTIEVSFPSSPQEVNSTGPLPSTRSKPAGPKFVAPRSIIDDSSSSNSIASSQHADDFVVMKARRQRRLSMEDKLSMLKAAMLEANSDAASSRSRRRQGEAKSRNKKSSKNSNNFNVASSDASSTVSSASSSSSDEASCMTEPPSPPQVSKKVHQAPPPKWNKARRRHSMSDCFIDIDLNMAASGEACDVLLPKLPLNTASNYKSQAATRSSGQFHYASKGASVTSTSNVSNSASKRATAGRPKKIDPTLPADYSKWDAAMDRYLQEQEQHANKSSTASRVAGMMPTSTSIHETTDGSTKKMPPPPPRNQKPQQRRRCSTTDVGYKKSHHDALSSTSNASKKSSNKTENKNAPPQASSSTYDRKKYSSVASSADDVPQMISKGYNGLDDSVSSLEASMRSIDDTKRRNMYSMDGSIGSLLEKSNNRCNMPKSPFQERKVVYSPAGVDEFASDEAVNNIVSRASNSRRVHPKKMDKGVRTAFGRRSSISGLDNVPHLSISSTKKITEMPFTKESIKEEKKKSSLSQQQSQCSSRPRRMMTRRVTVDCTPDHLIELRRGSATKNEQARRINLNKRSGANSSSSQDINNPLKQMLRDHEAFLTNVQERYTVTNA